MGVDGWRVVDHEMVRGGRGMCEDKFQSVCPTSHAEIRVAVLQPWDSAGEHKSQNSPSSYPFYIKLRDRRHTLSQFKFAVSGRCSLGSGFDAQRRSEVDVVEANFRTDAQCCTSLLRLGWLHFFGGCVTPSIF